MSYPAISLSTATAGRHRRPPKRLQTAVNLQSTRIRARIIAPVTPSPPFRCPHTLHPGPSVDSGLTPIRSIVAAKRWRCPTKGARPSRIFLVPRQPYHVRQLRLADVQQVHPQGLGAVGPPGRAAACKVWRYSPSRCRGRRRRRDHGFWSETDRLYQAGWPVDRRRVRKIPLDGQPVCPWLSGLEDVDSRGSVGRPGRSKLLRSLRKAL